MRCDTCGKEHPSKYYFVVDGLCRDCYDAMSEEERTRVREEAESLDPLGATERIVAGHELRCPVCAHDRFWKRKTLMNTPGLTFFGMEWANRQAENFVCDRCGHVLWFLREESPHEHA